MYLNSWTFGGVEEHASVLSIGLREHGYEPIVVCSAAPALSQLHQRLDIAGVQRRSTPGGGRLESIRRLAALLRAERIDLLHLQLIYFEGGRIPLLAAQIARVPVVVTHHAAPHTSRDHLPPFVRRGMLNLADEFIAVSDANRADQIRHLGLNPAKVTTVHNGVVVPADPPNRLEAHRQLTQELGLDPDAKLVGAVGRLTGQKQLHLILEAMAGLPEAHLVVAGDGELRSQLVAQAKDLGLSVHFLGFRADVTHLLSAIDVLAMSSSFEGLPLVLLEAFAAGTPAVSFDVDGIPEVIDDGVNGYLVPAGDVQLLAGRIRCILEDGARAAAMSVAARATITEGFTAQRMADETAAVYRRVIERR